MSIRKASQEDLEAVRELFTLWVQEDITYGEEVPSLEDFERYLQEIYFVAEYKNQIIGLLVATETFHTTALTIVPKNTRVIHLEELYVHPIYRNQQVGSKLLEKLFSEAEKRGVDHFLLYSGTKDWDKIIKFYKRHGFEPWYFQMFKRAKESK